MSLGTVAAVLANIVTAGGVLYTVLLGGGGETWLLALAVSVTYMLVTIVVGNPSTLKLVTALLLATVIGAVTYVVGAGAALPLIYAVIGNVALYRTYTSQTYPRTAPRHVPKYRLVRRVTS